MLNESEIAQFKRDGVLVRPNLFAPDEVAALLAAFDRDAGTSGDHRIVEPASQEVRALYASHRRQPEYASLARSPRLVGPARQLLGPEVYLYQFKINAKPAHGGDGWAWHQDYVAWRIADRLRSPSLVNAVLFLDDITETNGPIAFVAGSHADGLIRDRRSDRQRSSQHLDPDDIALSPQDLESLLDRHELVTPTCAAGTVVLFHPEIVHGSSPNLSPFARRVAIATYNDVHNLPRPAGEPRPEYLVCRDTRPLPIEEDRPIVDSGAAAR
ncbi:MULTISPECIES: phytanoyl-CoA dioxygenase family protein [unclassified Streptomyces]|uniref:phytanoyl-CoA dioxygenase family protein n=1 Tax=unclassified Streptomyces TaxID=2593676 RepID=UPI002E37323E|nr:phytanoyl-CoA dioxygenase family protein [Streptomyces sp. NBC_01477]